MAQTEIRTRFAPSPTGYMHIGNLRTALYGYLFARANDGTFILRIEDTDRSRYVADAVDFIRRTLDAAGIIPDEGPDEIGGDFGPYVQSERMAIYKQYVEQLVAEGHAYRCFCHQTEEAEPRLPTYLPRPHARGGAGASRPGRRVRHSAEDAARR